MTARQQRRLEQKLARKAQKRVQPYQAQSSAQAAPEAGCPRDSVGPTFTAEREAGSPRDSVAPTVNEPEAPNSYGISAAKRAANVANAQLSTGATTEAGKAIVSQNATKHGLTSKFNERTGRSGAVVRGFKVLPSESQSEFDQLLAGFLRAEAPVGADEIEMVHQMAEALWLSRRSVRLQNDCFAALELSTPEEQRAIHKSLALYIRYQTTHDRTFSRYAAELRKRRNERARVERGFVSQKHKEAAERRRHEMHAARQAVQNAKQEGQELRNRLAAAKAEALELKNLVKKTQLAAQTPEAAALAATA
ncbi:MAG TPA: hypothetical protein VFA65_07655 [Bryobacteraceae bacterium]|nr:hypothetical protein [Bryobacteraceae bacterium]